MKHFREFSRSHVSFSDRIGPPDEFTAAVGHIALGFSFLEDTIRNVLVLLAGTDRKTGLTLVLPLSFRQKLEIVEALAVHRTAQDPDESLKEEIAETLKLCRRAEELRNTYLHSSYAGIVRAKHSARSKRGLTVATEQATPDLLMDIADYVVHAAMQIEGLPILLGYATTHTATEDYSAYFQGDKEIARFRFGEIE